jgi:DNA replication and repair protein RecF
VVGAQISLAREKFVKKLSNNATSIIDNISLGKESLSIVYTGPIGQTRVEKTENILSELKKSKQKDLEVGYTNYGIHRDDIKFYINNIEVKPFASQGQQRSIILALKLAELEVFAREKECPILLLDDVFSELDNARQKYLYNYLKDKQVFITGTSLKNKPNFSFLNVKVKNGKLTFKKYSQ